MKNFSTFGEGKSSWDTHTKSDPKMCKSFPSSINSISPKIFQSTEDKIPQSLAAFPWIRDKPEQRIDGKTRRSRDKDSIQQQGMEELMAGNEFVSKSGTAELRGTANIL